MVLFFTIDEILLNQDSFASKRVRTLGRLHAFNFKDGTAIFCAVNQSATFPLSQKSSSVLMNVLLCAPFSHEIGTLMHIFGDVRLVVEKGEIHSKPVIDVILCIPCNDLDVASFLYAFSLKKQFYLS